MKSLPQCGQFTGVPTASSSAFNFWPHAGHKKRNSIVENQTTCATNIISGLYGEVKKNSQETRKETIGAHCGNNHSTKTRGMVILL